MKKFTSTDLGGAPVTKNDLRDIFNSEMWDSVQALLSQFNADTQGVVVSGCVTTANGGNFDMTAGIVYLNGEFMRTAAATNQSFTKYISPSTVVNDSRTFADSNSHVVAVTKGAELAGSAPGGSQYITIASLTDLDDRRLIYALDANKVNRVGNDTVTGVLTINGGIVTDTTTLKHKLVSIGDWNMDSTPLITVPHGITGLLSKRHSVHAMIIPDVGASVTWTKDLSSGGSCGVDLYVTGDIVLDRIGSGIFDTTDYDATSFNRGFILITYEP